MNEVKNKREGEFEGRDELIFNEYRLYSEQKENFIERNFKTNRFYMASVFVLIVCFNLHR